MSTEAPPSINITNQQRNTWDILGTLALLGGCGAIVYVAIGSSWAELVATGLVLFATMLFQLLFSRGLIKKPESTGEVRYFGKTGALVRQKIAEGKARWLRSPFSVLATVAIAYTVGILLVRAFALSSLAVFNNIIVLCGAIAIVVAMIFSPQIITSKIKMLREKVLRETEKKGPRVRAAEPVPEVEVAVPGKVKHHPVHVAGALVIFVIAGMLAHAWASKDVATAATGVTMSLVAFGKYLLDRGLLKRPELRYSGEDAGHGATLVREIGEFFEDSPVSLLALISMGYAVGFLVFRGWVTDLLGWFGNGFLAGLALAAVVGLVLAPVFWLESRRKGEDVDDSPEAVVPDE